MMLGQTKVEIGISRKNRDSGADLLRVFLMLTIVTHHCIVHGLGLVCLGSNAAPAAENHQVVLYVLNALCVCAVNGFFWLSGYFGIRRNWSKMAAMLLKCMVYAFLVGAFWQIYTQEFHGESLVSLLVQSVRNAAIEYWFMTAYFCLCFLAPYLNQVLHEIPVREKWIFMWGMILIDVYLGFRYNAIGIGTGYTLYHALTMYVIGYCCKEAENSDFRRWGKRSLLLTGYLLIGLLLGMRVYSLIDQGQYLKAWHQFSYNSPVILAASVALCLAFVNLRGENRLVSLLAKLGPYTLGVYLLSDSSIARGFLYVPMRRWVIAGGERAYAPKILIYALIIFTICITIEMIIQTSIQWMKKRKK